MDLRDFITIAGIATSAVGSYLAAMTRMRLKLQHLEDVKADRDELAQAFTGLKDGLHSLERQMTELDTKISLLLTARLNKTLSEGLERGEELISPCR
jgi:hypothetical protein